MPQIDISRYNLPPEKQTAKEKSTGLLDLLNKDISFGNAQLSDKKKEAFYNELSTLMQSGIDIKTALDLVTSSYTKLKDKDLFDDIKSRVVGGQTLSDTLKHSGKFSAYEYFSVKIGEETGRMAEVLRELAKYFKSKITQRRKIINAITYPAIVLCTSFGAIFFMIKFVVPMFADVFIRFGGKLPYITKLILKFSKSFNRFFYLGLFLLVGAVAFYLLNKNKIWFKKQSSLLLLKTPILGDILKKIYLARFANTMRLLVGTNTPLMNALGLVGQMISFYPIAHSLKQAEDDILHGSSLSASLGKHRFYPVKFIQIIKIAEEVNQLEYFFEQLSNQYTEEVEYKTNSISSLLEPLIIIFLGLVVGIILIAMYLPMFQMSNSF